MHINTLDVTSITPHRCTFEDPSWANHCSPTLDCTANLQLLKLCVNINMLCVKIYILRKTSGFVQITQIKLRKTYRALCAKVRQKNIRTKTTQVLRQKYGYFVETLLYLILKHILLPYQIFTGSPYHKKYY